MKILVCEPEKPPYVKEISEDVSDMQAVVGGYIEAVYFEEKGDADGRAEYLFSLERKLGLKLR